MRVEMEEMHDAFYEEDTCRLHELRRELERANKNCRILQYRVRKAERKHQRYTSGGEIDEELLRNLEQDLKEEECEDLKCQLSFMNEEMTMMRKKMAKLDKDKDDAEHQLQKYRSFYGEFDSLQFKGETVGPPTARQSELKLRLRLVEEEANILGRKIVELELENQALRAELDNLRGGGGLGGETEGVADANQAAGLSELRQQLQLVEDEAEFLRRNLADTEEQNRKVKSELKKLRFKEASRRAAEGGASSSMGGATAMEMLKEELKAARLQVNELSGKVMQLQYEKRVMLNKQSDEGGKEKRGGKAEREEEGEQGKGEQKIEEVTRAERRRGHAAPVCLSLPAYPPFHSSAPSPLTPRAPAHVGDPSRAERLTHTVELLIAHTQEFVTDGEDDDDDKDVRTRERQLLHRIGTQMNEFRDELQGFMGPNRQSEEEKKKKEQWRKTEQDSETENGGEKSEISQMKDFILV
ncbi:Protein SOGA3 [Bagarius yarrelli]|uniref:Protein SOGA3 n=1 Tax=Bagarius yarrelli TaxID=175774 RepID=A0A556VBP2_BAGYA|nr:Protein SOGA3 [Bagarius yarrelli]